MAKAVAASALFLAISTVTFSSRASISTLASIKTIVSLSGPSAFSPKSTLYAERSPSGTGVKSFFHVTAKDVRWFLDLIGVKPDSWGTSRSIPGEKPKKDHGPGFEIYFGQRYFTITADRWLGKPAQVHLLDRAVLQRLATLIGKPGPGSGGRDNSRSAKAFREALELRRAGKIKTFEEMR